MKELIKKHILEHSAVLDSIMLMDESIEKIANLFINCLGRGGTIFWCGNGGSASDSQHLAGELVGRFIKERKPLKSIALTADSAVTTCIVNDYGFEHIFSRQVEALGSKGDVLVGISTSGNSKNVIRAIEAAKAKGMKVVGLTGKDGGAMAELCDVEVRAPHSPFADRAQEIHIKVIHALIDYIEGEV